MVIFQSNIIYNEYNSKSEMRKKNSQKEKYIPNESRDCFLKC